MASSGAALCNFILAILILLLLFCQGKHSIVLLISTLLTVIGTLFIALDALMMTSQPEAAISSEENQKHSKSQPSSEQAPSSETLHASHQVKENTEVVDYCKGKELCVSSYNEKQMVFSEEEEESSVSEAEYESEEDYFFSIPLQQQGYSFGDLGHNEFQAKWSFEEMCVHAFQEKCSFKEVGCSLLQNSSIPTAPILHQQHLPTPTCSMVYDNHGGGDPWDTSSSSSSSSESADEDDGLIEVALKTQDPHHFLHKRYCMEEEDQQVSMISWRNSLSFVDDDNLIEIDLSNESFVPSTNKMEDKLSALAKE